MHIIAFYFQSSFLYEVEGLVPQIIKQGVNCQHGSSAPIGWVPRVLSVSPGVKDLDLSS